MVLKNERTTGLSAFLIVILFIPFYNHSFSQSSCIKINEFCVDPKDGPNGSPDNTGEFIELYNTCNCAINIGCFVLCMTDNSGGRRGDCVTIPSGTSIPAGGVYLLGGYGTNCTGGVSTCDWPGLSMNYNWHSSASSVWGVAGNAFWTTNVGNYIGVLADGGEDLSLFDATGTFIHGVYFDGGAGIGSNNTENIGAVSGCSAKSVIIPPTSSHTNVGNTPGSMGADGGFRRNCDNTWTAVQMASQTPGTALVCTLVSCVLPIEMVDFKAENIEGVNYLTWTTASEINNNYFTLEKSEDGFNFTDFGIVMSSGNSSVSKTYHLEDRQPFSPITYYRLKQTDYNGQNKYSNVIIAESSTIPVVVSEIYPNPANEIFYFRLSPGSNNTTQKLVVTVTNSLGKVMVIHNYGFVTEGIFSFEIPGLPSGFYNVCFSFGEEVMIKKLSLLR
jgi:hypothetical protein